MSWTEVNMREGLPDGGMPYETILWRMEETDPALVAAVRHMGSSMSDWRASGPGGAGRAGGPGGPASYAGGDYTAGGYDDYDDYARAEIIDWAPNAPYLESDHQRRDPSLSRSQLNLRVNGNRGSYDYLPQHPELYIGFTGNDPRGATNDPLLNQARGHANARAETITARMGDNDDNHLAERPWTNQSISYGMKEVHRRTKRNTKVFDIMREGRPWSQNVAADAARYGAGAGAERAAGADVGGEGLADAHLQDANSQDANSRFRGGDSGGAALMGAAPRTADGGVGAGASPAGPWRHTGGEAALGAARVGHARAAGPLAVGPAGSGGALAAATGADAAWAAAQTSRAPNRRQLAASAALAARHGRAVRLGRPETAPGGSLVRAGVGASARLAPAADGGRARRGAAADQAAADSRLARASDRGLAPAADGGRARRGAAADQAAADSRLAQSFDRGLAPAADGGRARRGARADQATADSRRAQSFDRGLAPAADGGRAVYETHAARARAAAGDHEHAGGAPAGVGAPADPAAPMRLTAAAATPNAHLTNAAAIVAGLREGTAAGRRKIAGAVLLDSADRGGRIREGGAAPARGMAPAADPGAAAARVVGGPGLGAAAARGLTVHAYSGAAPVQRRDVAVGGATYDGAALQRERDTVFTSQKLPEWRGGAETGALPGDAAFGGAGEVAARAALVGGRSLRAGASSTDGKALAGDELGGPGLASA
jgi:hypothetical protein